MDDVIPLMATVLAVAFAAAALVTLSMDLHVASGTLFLFTAFSIYLRETTGS
jgi:hypothetical protein